jgi:hypothetical protein
MPFQETYHVGYVRDPATLQVGTGASCDPV